MPRVNGYRPGSASFSAGSKPGGSPGPYTGSTGSPDSDSRPMPQDYWPVNHGRPRTGAAGGHAGDVRYAGTRAHGAFGLPGPRGRVAYGGLSEPGNRQMPLGKPLR